MSPLSAVLILLAVTAADTPAVYTAGDGIMPPRVIARTAPEYTPEARQAKLEGSVAVRLIVNADGAPERIYVLRSLGLGLDEKAIEAVHDWQFAPGMKDGKAVAVLTTVDVPFHLLSQRSDWHLARAAFDSPAGVSLPAIESAPYPDASGPEQYAAVSLEFEIDEHGVPVNIHAVKSSDAKFEAELIAMLRAWRFRPAESNGVTVDVSATFDFERGRPATS